jgi:hypothetical protein
VEPLRPAPPFHGKPHLGYLGGQGLTLPLRIRLTAQQGKQIIAGSSQSLCDGFLVALYPALYGRALSVSRCHTS